MKNIDIKSLIIGALLTSTIFLGVAATSPTDKWDNDQKWVIVEFDSDDLKAGRQEGYELTGNSRKVIKGSGQFQFAELYWTGRKRVK